jgi:hypothetical protein
MIHLLPSRGGRHYVEKMASWPTPNARPQNLNDSTWEAHREALKAKHINGNSFVVTRLNPLIEEQCNDHSRSGFAHPRLLLLAKHNAGLGRRRSPAPVLVEAAHGDGGGSRDIRSGIARPFGPFTAMIAITITP